MPEFTLAPEEADVLRLIGQRDKVTLPELGVVLHLTPSDARQRIARLAASGLVSVDDDGAIVTVTNQGREATHVLSSGALTDAKVRVTIVPGGELTGAA